MNPQARWLWGAGKASPRNAWRAFRKTFQVLPEGWNGARLTLTADSRYVLFVNGQRVGRGPARSWPDEQAYDGWEVGHLLRAGEANTVAVLVHHFGVSTFCYLRGRGGLVAQLDLLSGAEPVDQIVTDGSWKTAPHGGYSPDAPRMSVQLGFAERYDACGWDDTWTSGTFDDATWEEALELGPVGTPPWTRLVPSGIPPLTEEVRYPRQVVSLGEIEPVRYAAVLDVCAQMMPNSAEHANIVEYGGFVSTVVRVREPTSLTFGSPLGALGGFRRVLLDGRPLERYGDNPARFADVDLEAGDHLVLVDVSGRSRSGLGLYLGFSSDRAVDFISPFGGETPFVSVGPFAEAVHIDHEPPPAFRPDEALMERVASAGSAAELLAFHGWLRPFPAALVGEDVFTTCVWTHARTPHPVPTALQALAVPNGVPTEIPRLPGGDTELVLDFGAETSGYLTFEADAPAGAVLDFYGFEYLQDGWRQDTYGLDNTLRYRCRAGSQRFTSAVRRGLRYLMVVVRDASRPVRFRSVTMLESTYPTPEVGQFTCSDTLLNNIYDISRRTTKLCMEDTFVDCPAYEQTFWVGDSRNEALVASYLFGAEALTARCLRLVPPSGRYTPLYTDQVPSGWNSVIPNWTFFWVVACWEFYERTGDAAFARELWPHVRLALESFLQKLDGRGLLSLRAWNLLDWAPLDQPNEGVVAHQNMFLVKALGCADRFAKAAGQTPIFEAAADGLREAINAHLWSDLEGAFRDAIFADGRSSEVFSVQTQVVAYLCGVAEGRGERQARLGALILEPPQSFVQIGSPFMSFFLYEALAKLGRIDQLVADVREKYGEMLRYGATTCWEMYPGPENRADPRLLTRSHCHAWSAAPGYVLPAYVLGVRGAAPGWSAVEVAPEPGDLLWARGRVPLPRAGVLEVAWQREGDRLSVEVQAPEGIAVEVRLPKGFSGETRVHRL